MASQRNHMAKRATGLKPHKKSPRSHKTVKRITAKKVMLASKMDKKLSVHKRCCK